jgi:hypothetical protein
MVRAEGITSFNIAFPSSIAARVIALGVWSRGHSSSMPLIAWTICAAPGLNVSDNGKSKCSRRSADMVRSYSMREA